MDSNVEVTFNKSGNAWLYTHDSQRTSRVGKDYDVKQYVMDALDIEKLIHNNDKF